MDQIPTIVHPPLVHFAIVLPIMIVLLELVNIIVKRGETPEEPKGRGVSTLSFLLIIAMVVIFALSYITGSVDGKASWEGLSKVGQVDLKAHKLLGTYLVYGSLVLLVFKFISLVGSKSRILFLLLAIVFAATTLKQGKMGGELVYTHGANVAVVKEFDDKIFDLNDDMSDLKDEISDLKDENAKLKASVATPAPVAAPETKKETPVAAMEAPVVTAPTPQVHEEAKAEVATTEAKDEKQAVASSEAFVQESQTDTQKEATPPEAVTIENENGSAVAQ